MQVFKSGAVGRPLSASIRGLCPLRVAAPLPPINPPKNLCERFTDTRRNHTQRTILTTLTQPNCLCCSANLLLVLQKPGTKQRHQPFITIHGSLETRQPLTRIGDDGHSSRIRPGPRPPRRRSRTANGAITESNFRLQGRARMAGPPWTPHRAVLRRTSSRTYF
jgi:hypothetical protein